MTHDNRHFHRILYNANAILTTPKARYQCKIIDLSLKGCLLKFDQAWKESPDTLSILTLQLSKETSITMELSVAHFFDQDVGFKCVHIDIDSISQLRRLVELNLGDSTLLERDMIALSSQEAH